MKKIGIAEIQRNSSIFSNMTEVMQIVDKRKKRILATVYPAKRPSVVGKLAGKYKSRVASVEIPMDEIRERAMEMAMKEKYGLPA